MGTIKFYRYVGPAFRPLGGYGARVEGAHTRLDDPDNLYALDPNFGDVLLCWVEDAGINGFVFVCEETAHKDPVRT